MADEVPVRRNDLLALAAVSVVGGFLIASWTLTPQLSPNFAAAVSSGAVMLSFFLILPVLALRSHLEERRASEEGPETGR